jgi:hypothetical protein
MVSRKQISKLIINSVVGWALFVSSSLYSETSQAEIVWNGIYSALRPIRGVTTVYGGGGYEIMGHLNINIRVGTQISGSEVQELIRKGIAIEQDFRRVDIPRITNEEHNNPNRFPPRRRAEKTIFAGEIHHNGYYVATEHMVLRNGARRAPGQGLSAKDILDNDIPRDSFTSLGDCSDALNHRR